MSIFLQSRGYFNFLMLALPVEYIFLTTFYGLYFNHQLHIYITQFQVLSFSVHRNGVSVLVCIIISSMIQGSFFSLVGSFFQNISPYNLWNALAHTNNCFKSDQVQTIFG